MELYGVEDFYPRPPRGGRPAAPCSCPTPQADFYPRPPRGGRLRWLFPSPRSSYFYPRPPRGGRPRDSPARPCPGAFLSTPSARRATSSVPVMPMAVMVFLSTPSARRATRNFLEIFTGDGISIHALREEGDETMRAISLILSYFYPRPPRGGRLCRGRTQNQDIVISIHALREEGDRCSCSS